MEKLLEHLLKERGEEAGARAYDDLGCLGQSSTAGTFFFFVNNLTPRDA